MSKYYLQTNPFVVPVPGNKLIEEHFGLASLNAGEFSFAHMIAPPGWSEPFQTPAFDELTFVYKGKKQINLDGEIIVLSAGQSVLIKRDVKIQYSNPFDEACEYVSLCMPAFSPELVRREEL